MTYRDKETGEMVGGLYLYEVSGWRYFDGSIYINSISERDFYAPINIVKESIEFIKAYKSRIKNDKINGFYLIDNNLSKLPVIATKFVGIVVSSYKLKSFCSINKFGKDVVSIGQLNKNASIVDGDCIFIDIKDVYNDHLISHMEKPIDYSQESICIQPLKSISKSQFMAMCEDSWKKSVECLNKFDRTKIIGSIMHKDGGTTSYFNEMPSPYMSLIYFIIDSMNDFNKKQDN